MSPTLPPRFPPAVEPMRYMWNATFSHSFNDQGELKISNVELMNCSQVSLYSTDPNDSREQCGIILTQDSKYGHILTSTSSFPSSSTLTHLPTGSSQAPSKMNTLTVPFPSARSTSIPTLTNGSVLKGRGKEISLVLTDLEYEEYSEDVRSHIFVSAIPGTAWTDKGGGIPHEQKITVITQGLERFLREFANGSLQSVSIVRPAVLSSTHEREKIGSYGQTTSALSRRKGRDTYYSRL
ncbi:hypothetical protein TREMEDRAFT_64086 [Tremella mesenterica DSM 1558]|uniref:uncharacterized protein n=1 Tax=Tremella mesenterica (strain ATCC 24925 / CBS 8224 / DSM 1558 / NBRC 9311 / NRRL Y-6157 / RJB 2259-6 / UBC 559-6) TaxID=578456 RepID=UPI0003F48F27|nr:uncharacterized protein TREMEDRAFT_64086 [Tremella mesenterica DSM 1558]EIW67506.1 hypothetical protein TREMEDRAFT_64086 [Tremella mesenterica DSM 1558]